MNGFRLFVWLLLYALFLARVAFFHAYLFILFISKDGAAWLLFLLSAGALLLSWPVTGPVLEAWFAPAQAEVDTYARALARETDFGAELMPFAAWALEAAILAAGLVAVWCLRRIAGVLRILLAAFPMPARPLPPQRVWMPPAHRVRAVTCRLDVPRLPLRWWNGATADLTACLAPEVRRLIGQPEEAFPVPPRPPAGPEEQTAAPEPAAQPAE